MWAVWRTPHQIQVTTGLGGKGGSGMSISHPGYGSIKEDVVN